MKLWLVDGTYTNLILYSIIFLVVFFSNKYLEEPKKDYIKILEKSHFIVLYSTVR